MSALSGSRTLLEQVALLVVVKEQWSQFRSITVVGKFFDPQESLPEVDHEDEEAGDTSTGHTSEYVTKNIDSEFLTSTDEPEKIDEKFETESSVASFDCKPSHLNYPSTFTLVFEKRPLGMRVRPNTESGKGVVVSSFKNPNLQNTQLEVGCKIITVNGVSVRNMTYDEFIRVIKAAAMPVTLEFKLPFDDTEQLTSADIGTTTDDVENKKEKSTELTWPTR
eukprot:TRINITY_DN3007_c0_g1_i1.p1 TRINITY_DN3007_c0_g1~~TRINITY_DN3007_c0_g1_i1.p1  ORF type:complete len:222 (+),score=34.64 TRINITY_DN3007_c0_g1_i1:220-885(+)